ncbi:hypothetical protein D9613_000482 [Agrocybe pediades]|uniref:RanBD1 domain-containing protein n=1 Tax=Agrocybe pediades TaxID=84607 RepID=A0A8H4VRX8_9AGAR|nr:hypothetical protein D9613_000482 [Agrocybe pediades]
MKRQAEAQLTKDGQEEEEVEETGQGFKKADEKVLATRVIRGLPNRARPQNAAPAPAPALSPASTEAPKPPSLFSVSSSSGSSFSSFGQFPVKSEFSFTSTTSAQGNTSSTANPFAASPSAPAPTSLFSTPTKSPFTFSSSTQSSSPPTVASTATNTSKAFASILNSTTPPASISAFPSTSTSAQNGDGQHNKAALTSYYSKLRGLNVSFRSTITKALEDDPFLDLAGYFESYKSIRTKIQKEKEGSSDKTSSKPESTSSPQAPSSNKLTMPAPPAAFSFGGLKPVNPVTPSPPASTTTPSMSKPSFFEFKPPAALASSSTSNPFAPASKDSSPTSSSSSIFGQPASSKPSETTAKPPSAPSSVFSFGNTDKATTSTSSPFGTFGTSTSTPFSFGSSATGATDKPASSSSNLFGGSDKTTAASPFTASKEPPKPFFFGSSSSSSSTSIFGGAKPATAEKTTEATGETATEGETSDRATPATEGGDAEAAPTLMGTNPWTEEGEGEENEETVHSVKTKAYKLAKGEDGSSKWAPLGTGIVRLKKDKDSGSRRMLLRNATNGKVVINFIIYAGLKPTQSKTAVSFVGHDAGASQTYTIRMANENEAKEFKTALEREIAFVKAKDES